LALVVNGVLEIIH